MIRRQRHILRVLSSICVGSVAFCLILLILLLAGTILLSMLGLMKEDGFFPTDFVILFLASILVGIIVAVFVGIKYYRYLEKSE